MWELSHVSTLLCLSALLGLALLLTRSRLGALVAGLTLAAIAVAALSPVGNLLLGQLEQRFPAGAYPSAQDLDGIIILTGSYGTEVDPRRIILEEDAWPLAVAPDLARRYPEAKLVFVGGITDASTPEVSEGSTMKPYFAKFGVEPQRILTESESRSISQNAQGAANLLHPSPSSRWLLVTYGYRMPRAIGAFRQSGFNVSAFPICLRVNASRKMWRSDDTATDNIENLDIAAREWLALVWYKLRGYSGDWFPSPLQNKERRQPMDDLDAYQKVRGGHTGPSRRVDE